MRWLWRGLRLAILNGLFLVLLAVMVSRYMAGQPLLPELTEAIGIWEELLGVER